MKILVTGAAGFIGAHLMYKLAKRGDDVVGIDYLSDYNDIRLKLSRLEHCGFTDTKPFKAGSMCTSSMFSNCQFQKVDIADKPSLYRLFHDGQFDKVVHLAAQVGSRYSVVNPAGLRKFCDYILLATVNDKLYVILVEMKSGKPAGATQQLAASKTFIDYIKASAERIKSLCDCDEFDSKKIILRKVLLKPVPKTRPTTNIGKVNTEINWGADPIELKSSVFPLLKVCECRQR